MIYDMVIAVPVGIAAPGTPVVNYLDWGIDSILNQKTNYKFKLVFGADNNISDEAKRILEKHGVDVQWYEPYTFMRKGSIWRKIYDQWQRYDTKYVAFSHYDDMWHPEKIEHHLNAMEKEQLEMSWSYVRVIDENNTEITGTVGTHKTLNRNTLVSGTPYAFCHASVFNKQALFSTGILDYIDLSAANYETVQYIFSHKLNGRVIPDTFYYHRMHRDSITSQWGQEQDYMTKQREVANYSLKEVLEDRDKQNLGAVISEIEQYLASKEGVLS